VWCGKGEGYYDISILPIRQMKFQWLFPLWSRVTLLGTASKPITKEMKELGRLKKGFA